MSANAVSRKFPIDGLDGSKPCGFLVALGTLRTLAAIYPAAEFRLSWSLADNIWRPVLSSASFAFNDASIVDDMRRWLIARPLAKNEELLVEMLSKHPSLDDVKAVRYASRLAVEAVPLFQHPPLGIDQNTADGHSVSEMETFWSWPVWRPAITLTTLQLLIRHPSFVYASEDMRAPKLGIAAVFRSPRITGR